ALTRLNKGLRDTGQEANSTGQGLGKALDAEQPRRFTSALDGSMKALKGMSVLAGSMLAGTAAAVAALNASMVPMESGLRNIIQLNGNARFMGELASEVQEVTRG